MGEVGGESMAEEGDPEDRLEAALERIAKSIDGGRRPVQSAGESAVGSEVVARLDRMIATVRKTLGEAPGK